MNSEVSKVPILRMEHIDKSFSGVSVLNDVTLEAYSGEILALLGQNGAGKSTLMKILSGIHPAGSYTGTVCLDGQELRSHGLLEAEKNGVVMIPQEIEVCSNLNVAETLYINELSQKGLINWNEIYTRARNDLENFGITDIAPNCPMHRLSKSQHQLILIAKAFAQARKDGGCKVLILDEPTASLSNHESQILFDHLRMAKNNGLACIYISHRLKEVFDISDRLAIMRDGRMIGSYLMDEIEMDDAITQIIGQRLNKVKNAENAQLGEVVLEANGLSVYSVDMDQRQVVKDVSFRLHEGEVLGVFGLLGSGKTEIAMTLYGAWQGAHMGEIKVFGEPAEFKSVSDAIKAGIGFLPEDRRVALMEVRSIAENMVLVFLNRVCDRIGMLNKGRERSIIKDLRQRLGLKAVSLDNLPSTLSGGNKQKILIAKLLGAESRIIIADEPTVGVDVNTRQDIYRILTDLAIQKRCAVLLFSSDIEEIIQVSNQIMVLQNGEIVDFFDQEAIASGAINADRVLKAAVTG